MKATRARCPHTIKTRLPVSNKCPSMDLTMSQTAAAPLRLAAPSARGASVSSAASSWNSKARVDSPR
eukprot:5201106-Pyramimonas_sp.AAC.1